MCFLLTSCGDNVVEFKRFSKFCISNFENRIQVVGMLGGGFWAVEELDSWKEGDYLILIIKQEKPDGFNSGSFKFKES